MPEESDAMMREFIEVCGPEEDWPHRNDWSWANALAAFKSGWNAGKSFQHRSQADLPNTPACDCGAWVYATHKKWCARNTASR